MPRSKNQNFWRTRGTPAFAPTSYSLEARAYSHLSNSKHPFIGAALAETQSQGHTYFTANLPVSGMVNLGGKLYFKELLAAETSIVSRIHSLLSRHEKAMACPSPLGLAEKQEAAFRLAFSSPISIITGGPGTGKTTTSSAILLAALNLGLQPLAMAPTGKAAKRMEEALAGHLKPSTIHRGLKWGNIEEGNEIGGAPFFGKHKPLPSEFLLIDECSMIDLPLMAYLLDAVSDTASIVFVGDADQLPPVGPGQPFLDFIKSGVIPITTLDRIFRQVEGSSISLACQAINKGNPSDFFAAAENSPEITLIESANTLKSICQLASNSSTELQVLSPKRDSTALLNNHLAPILNPRGEGRAMASPYTELPLAFDSIGHVGDKVQQIKNNYFRGVFNGDQGIIEKVGFMDVAVHRITRGKKMQVYSSWGELPEDRSNEFVGAVKMSDLYLPYMADEAVAELMLAYAITVHRSQGSEWGEIAIDINPGAYGFLSRRLFFTALSRARRHAYIAGTPSAIAKAIMTNRDDFRRTALAERLKDGRV